MKLTHYLYLIPLVLLAACGSEEQITTSTTTEKRGEAIELSAGIVEGSARASTRVDGEKEEHTNHKQLSTDTKLALFVSGEWTGHDPSTISKTTKATVTSIVESDTHSKLSDFDPVLYWDDYGTADPDNTNNGSGEKKGREKGLTIYGAAIDGKDAGIDLSTSRSVSWTLPEDQSASGSTPADKDLLISNNVSSGTETSYSSEGKWLDCGTYKFDDFFTHSRGKLLEFHHALSKITVILTPGAGFNDAFSSTAVTLTSKETASSSAAEWALTTGQVDVTTGGVTLTGEGTPKAITMNKAATADDGKVTMEALVMPGSSFVSNEANILKINADDNIYYVNATKIRAAITEEEKTTKPGTNYIIKVTVNKTDINVTATIANWSTVTAEEVEPVIKVTTSYGTTQDSSNKFDKNEFSFYRSTSMDAGYSSEEGLCVNNYYKPIRTVKYADSKWEMYVDDTKTPLYWPNHNTHYQFRGVWPETGTETGEQSYPRVETKDSKQVIKVKNVAYTVNTFPSDLQIARPDVATDATCNNSDHIAKNLWSDGICATEGSINLKFDYMMSKVEVNLSTTSGTDAVTLTNAKVEIVNVYNTADVTLGSREVIPTDTKGSYELNTVSGDGNENKRLSAIVPQTLTYTTAQASTNVKFRITITNSNSTTDVYYCDVNPILESGKSTKVAPNDKWESGYHYVYNLKLSKTEVKVTATLANWTKVTASQDVWF